jgi:hypothetical protein
VPQQQRNGSAERPRPDPVGERCNAWRRWRRSPAQQPAAVVFAAALVRSPAATRGDVVPPSPKALPNGRYYLSTTATWGRLAFTQRCPS